MDSPDIQPIQQLGCCRVHAEAHGLGKDALCPSCSDYRHYLNDVRYKDPAPVVPAGFQHTPFKETEFGRKWIEAEEAAKADTHKTRRSRNGKVR